MLSMLLTLLFGVDAVIVMTVMTGGNCFVCGYYSTLFSSMWRILERINSFGVAWQLQAAIV